MSSHLSKFSKTMTPNCFSFVYLELEKFIVTEHTEISRGIDQFFKNNYRLVQ